MRVNLGGWERFCRHGKWDRVSRSESRSVWGGTETTTYYRCECGGPPPAPTIGDEYIGAFGFIALIVGLFVFFNSGLFGPVLYLLTLVAVCCAVYAVRLLDYHYSNSMARAAWMAMFEEDSPPTSTAEP